MALTVVPAFGGHVWGIESFITALIPQVIYQIPIAFWLGALCYVILLLKWQRKQGDFSLWREFRSCFVYRMIIAFSLVVLSGIMITYFQTGITTIFTDWKVWSGLMISKIVLTIVILGMVVFQTIIWKKSESFTTVHLIKREWIIGLVIIALGVWMGQIPYPIAVDSHENTLDKKQVAKIGNNASKSKNRDITSDI